MAAIGLGSSAWHGGHTSHDMVCIPANWWGMLSDCGYRELYLGECHRPLRMLKLCHSTHTYI